jgi:pimeloyl-ACP methyl ester carboxylesterase
VTVTIEQGQLFDVGGHRLHIHSVGSGSPTVLFDAGNGGGVRDWSLVQQEVAKFTSASAYDRAGYGQSESGPLPRTSEACVKDLHNLLSAAGVTRPLVLVGHSFGCHNMRLYAASFPTEVAGVVLVEPPHEAMGVRLPPAFQHARAKKWKQIRTMRLLARAGLLHLVRAFLPKNAPPIARAMLADVSVRRFDTALAEIDAMPQSDELVGRHHSLGDLPLLVLSADKSLATFEPRDYPKGTNLDQVQRVWMELLHDVARASSRGTLLPVSDSGHHVPLERPAAVVDAIHHVVADLRKPNAL